MSSESGIPGLDEFLASAGFTDGFPENTTTLIYGPPKVGKSIFCYQFAYHGMSINEPCLYVTADEGMKTNTTKHDRFRMVFTKFHG